MSDNIGKGGAYIIDGSGKHVLVERTGEKPAADSKVIVSEHPPVYTKAKKIFKASEI